MICFVMEKAELPPTCDLYRDSGSASTIRLRTELTVGREGEWHRRSGSTDSGCASLINQ